jgi:hypothetical protein
MAMLEGSGRGGGENPNVAKAKAAAARGSQGGEARSDEEEWAEMKKRRDEWNRRVQRTVRKGEEP